MSDLDEALKILYGETADTNQIRDGINARDENALKSIEKQYKKLARLHHPDRGGDPEKFKNIGKARTDITALYASESKSQSSMESTKKTEQNYASAISLMSDYSTLLKTSFEKDYSSREDFDNTNDILELANEQAEQIVELSSELNCNIDHDTLRIFQELHLAELNNSIQLISLYKKQLKKKIKDKSLEGTKEIIGQAFAKIDQTKKNYTIDGKTGDLFTWFRKAEKYIDKKYRALAQEEEQRAAVNPPSPITVIDVGKIFPSDQKLSPFEKEINFLNNLSQEITRITEKLNTNPTLDKLSELKKELTLTSTQSKSSLKLISMKIDDKRKFRTDDKLTKEETSVKERITDVKMNISTALKAVNRKIENANKRKAEAKATATATAPATAKATAEKRRKPRKPKKPKKRTSTPTSRRRSGSGSGSSSSSSSSSSRTTSQTNRATPKSFELNKNEILGDVHGRLQEHIFQTLKLSPDTTAPMKFALNAAQEYLKDNHDTMNKGNKEKGLKETIKLINNLSKTTDPKLVTKLLNTWAETGKFFCSKAPRRQFAAEALAKIEAEQQKSPPVSSAPGSKS